MRRTSLALALLGLFSVAPALSAQTAEQSAVDLELRSMVVTESATDAQRAGLDAFLDRDDVAAAAAERNIDLDRVRDGVATLDDSEITNLVNRIADATGSDDLVGGDTFVVTSSTVIIILLLIILIIVA